MIKEKVPVVKTRVLKKRQCRLDSTEGRYVRFLLGDVGFTATRIASELNCSIPVVSQVLYGLRHSAKIEGYIASVLGYERWNDLVLDVQEQLKTMRVGAKNSEVA